jgi:hypothetical protein
VVKKRETDQTSNTADHDQQSCLGTAQPAGATTIGSSPAISSRITTNHQPIQALPSQHAPIRVPRYHTNPIQSSNKPPHTSTTWAGSLGHPVTPAKPLTAAASLRIARVARAAGRVGMLSSPVWIGMIFWTELRMIRRRGGNVRRRLSSSRLLVRRLGYVHSAFAGLYILVREKSSLLGLDNLGIRC